MYHSHLLINVGDNPDRPDWNITRKWLRNLYRVHQRLCMAFPSKVPESQRERVGAYCAPFAGACSPNSRELPGEPDQTDLHHARSDESGFLFRIDHPVDHERGVRRPVITVQSANEPDWDWAFGLDRNAVDDRGRPVGNASFLLATPPRHWKIDLSIEGQALALTCEASPKQDVRIEPGDRVRFRLRANPVRTIDGKRHRLRMSGEDFNAGGERREMAFVKMHEEWLAGKLGDAADDVECFCRDSEGQRVKTLTTGWASGWRTKHEPQPNQKMQWWSVLFEGSFRVKNTETLMKHVSSGIGPAKAFGFGLLSIAPL